MKKILLILTFLTSWVVATAQTYPVQVNPQLIPPYSLKLSDYQTTTSEKLFVNLLLTDISEIGRQVRLKMYIEGQGLNIQTLDFVSGAVPIFLDGGINLRLSNLDLQPYFAINNLQGITPQQYSQTLPDGLYNFCFEVYDFVSGQRLSRKSCFPVVLILNDPPFLNMPNNGDLVTAQNPQNIIFNWTPRHLNATNVQYEFTLKELWDTNIDPQAAFLASPVLYQNTVFPTTLLYGPAEIPLIEGKTYGWQVRAFVSDGISETSVFRNNGLSEIWHFTYEGNCDVPTFVLSEAQNSQTVQITWQTSDHISYNIQYRKLGMGDEDWFEIVSYNPQVIIHNLEPGTTYEFRVGGQCTVDGGFAYATIQQFTTPTDEEDAYYNCGVMPTVTISNQNLLPNIGVNQEFTAGDFPVTVKQVEGSNGIFTGWGYIIVPYLEDTKIRVEFTNIHINTDFQLIDGIVETTYDPNWEGIESIDDLIDDIAGDNGTINQFDATNIDIASVTVDADGNVILIDEQNGEHPIETDLPVTITDINGDQWTINEDGTITEGHVAEGGIPNNDNTNGISNNGTVTQISSTDVSIIFNPSGFYGTDQLPQNVQEPSFINKYETIEKAGGGEYKVLYKAVSNNPIVNDELTATATFSNGKTTDDIVFKTKQGAAIPFTWSGNTATLTVKKQFNFAKDEILATVKPADTTANYDIAGKANVWHFTQQTVNVTVVPLNGISANETDLNTQINAIYNKAGVHFNVVVDTTPFNIDPSIWDGNGNGNLDIGDSTLLAQYTSEESAIYNYYKTEHGVVSEMYYIFLTDMTTTDPNTKGFMPLKRQYGFIFDQSAQTQARTIAHELGHGVFGLAHYEDAYTNNLLMYMADANGTDFTHMDWQKMHAPGFHLYLFQSDEDGEQITNNPLLSKLQQLSIDTGVKHFAIVHCDDCTVSQPLDGGQFFSFNSLSSELQTSIINDAVNGDVVGVQLLTKDNKKCLAVIYKETGTTLNADEMVLNATNMSDTINAGLWFYDLENQEELDCSSNLSSDWRNYICDFTSQNSEISYNSSTVNTYFNSLFSAITDCLPSYTISEITTLLQNLKTQSRGNQDFEYVQGNKVYKLNTQNEAEEIQNPLTEQQINNGDWTDTNIDVKIRVSHTINGYLHFNAVGIRSDLSLADGKTATLTTISEDIKTKANSYFNTYQVTNATVTLSDKGLNFDKVLLADNSSIAIAEIKIDQQASLFKVVTEGIGALTALLKTAKIEQPIYLENTPNTLKYSPIITGSGEAGVKAVTDITQMVVMVYGLAVDEQARTEAINGFTAIKNQVSDDPTALFPILKEVILEEATGNTGAEWIEATSETTNIGRRNHLKTKGGVRTACTVFVSAKFITKLPEMAEKVAKKLIRGKGRIGIKNLDEIGEITEALKDALLTKVKNLSDNGQAFFEDFANASEDILREFVENPNLVDSWEKVRTAIGNTTNNGFTELAINTDVLNKVSNLMKSNSNFRNAFSGNWQSKLDEIIRINKDLRCSTCTGGINRIPPLDEVLDNLEFISQYNNVEGFDKVLNLVKSNINNRDGINHMLSYIKNHADDFEQIAQFEYKYSDELLNTADLFANNIKFEFKSWTPDIPNPWNSFFSGTGNSYTQFTRYLENTTSLNDLKYVFNINKADITMVKSAFKDLFIDKADEIFQANENLFKQFDRIGGGKIRNYSEFETLINHSSFTTNHPMFDFIKVE